MFTKKRIAVVALGLAVMSCGGGSDFIYSPANMSLPNLTQVTKTASPIMNGISSDLSKGGTFRASFGTKIGADEEVTQKVKDVNGNDVNVIYRTSSETLQDRVTNTVIGDPNKRLGWNEFDLGYEYRNLNNYKKGLKTETGQALDGTGVKVGVIDNGFENKTKYESFLSGLNTELVRQTGEKYRENSAKSSHGPTVTATAAIYAPKAEYKLVDASSEMEKDSTTKAMMGYDERDAIRKLQAVGVKIINRSYTSEIDTREYKDFNFNKFNDMTIVEIAQLFDDVKNNRMTKEQFKSTYGSDYDKFEKIYWTYLPVYKEFVDNGELILTGAGNKVGADGKSDDYNMTGRSAFYAANKELRKGMLTVGGVIDNLFVDENGDAYANYEGGPQLAPYSPEWAYEHTEGYSPASNLGNTKYSFMVAEAEYRYKNGVIERGTSMASPAVAGTAALIKQKYPWMDGNLIRQTLITTATDIGEKGVDSVYGWGLLNISKAVNGPALFSKAAAFEDNVTVNFDNYVSVFSNNIGGDAGLIKQGNGTLVLGGYNTYTGDTKVENGKLYVTNNMTSKIINDALATTVLSRASVASVSNSGTLYSMGQNRVASLDSAPNSVVVADSNSRITVAEKSDLSNVNLKVNVDKYVTKAGDTNNYIGGNVENKYNSVSADGNYNVKNTEKGNVNISRASMANVVAEGQESSLNVASNLDSAFDSLDKEVKAGTANADVLEQAKELQKVASSVATASSLQSLSGEVYASAQALTFEQAQTINKDLSNRLNQIGVLDDTGNGGYWLSGIGGKGKITKKGYASADTKTLGSMFGVDKKFGDNLILGTAIAYSNSDAKFDSNAGKSESKSVNISLYGRYGQKDNPVYVQGRLGLGFVDSDVERNVITGNIVNSEKINHKDKVISAYVESGYNVKKGNFTFTPYAALENDTVIRGKFDEKSKFAISASKKTYNQTNATVGLRGTQSFGAVKLNGYVEYKHALNREDLSFDAKFNGIDKDITVKGIGLNNNRTWAGIGIVHEVTPKFSWYGNYDLKLEKNKGRNNVFTIGFRVNY